jgi:hypothetical protein
MYVMFLYIDVAEENKSILGIYLCGGSFIVVLNIYSLYICVLLVKAPVGQ